MHRKTLGIYLLCATVYQAIADYRDFHNYSKSWLWVPRPGLLILLDWLSPRDVRTITKLDVICILWLLGMGGAMFFTEAALKIYVVSEVAFLTPSVLYLLLMLFTPGGHAVPPISVLMLQTFVIAMFSAFPLYLSLTLIRKERSRL